MTPNLRILVVDDDPHMTATLRDILTLAGHQVVASTSGLDALAKIRSQDFDCLLTDVRMPGMHGVELHHAARQEKPGLPVLLMTAYAADAVIQQGLEQGIVGVLNKPLNIAHLLLFFNLLAAERTIAIVDNDPHFCRTLGDILQKRGFTVSRITDPHAGVDLMAAGSQTILLDMKLNSISGLDVLKGIRARYPALPVLLVTGYREEMADAIRAALEISAFACLYKPLEIPLLLETLANLQLTRLRQAFTKK